MNVTLFQADCENSGPIMARPSRNTSAGGSFDRKLAVVGLGEVQPLAGEFHHDDVHAAALPLTPRVSPTTIRPTSAAVLANVNEFWIRVAEPQSARVGEGQDAIKTRATICWVDRLRA